MFFKSYCCCYCLVYINVNSLIVFSDGHTLQPAVSSTEERQALVEYVALFSPVSEEDEWQRPHFLGKNVQMLWPAQLKC